MDIERKAKTKAVRITMETYLYVQLCICFLLLLFYEKKNIRFGASLIPFLGEERLTLPRRLALQLAQLSFAQKRRRTKHPIAEQTQGKMESICFI